MYKFFKGCEKMATVAERIKEALEFNDMKQADLIKKTGINKSALSSYLSGKYIPKQTNIYLMAKALNVNEAWLMGKDVTKNRVLSATSPGKSIRIPVLGRVAAGIPIEAIEEIVDYEEINDKLASLGEMFGLIIKGDSMTPRICDGDVVIVRKQENADSGDIVIATINGDDAVCKKLMIYDSAILLRSFNPIYEDIDVTGRSDFHIMGKVIELRGKL